MPFLNNFMFNFLRKNPLKAHIAILNSLKNEIKSINPNNFYFSGYDKKLII